MLKEEFEKLIGRTATDGEYMQANCVYETCSSDIDKQTLCAEWSRLKDSKVVSDLVVTMKNTTIRLDTTKQNLINMAKALIDVMEANGSYDVSAVNKLRGIMGDRWYIVYKVLQRYVLDDADRHYICENLR